ncbi:response regulator transcription factor [Paeniglutamicibacter gangotriensis]|uniref:Response regulator transcription factor n=1 Tax=Paeniglutamicibacter gangotriensis TaxID=254787 RepID=A0A5B0EB32_9MICC|nr:response regulator transcription factor [Paeniglutamicibacter gangotriensis]KAA0976234.1 response regulator transcription factor [Paeniglutamicibacter gangotriensis]
MSSIRILICDDQALIRSSLELILGTEESFEVVGTAADGQGAVDATLELRPDVVLMDIQMPVLDGVGATAKITAATDAKVVVLTTFDRDDYLFAAIDAGASGFLLKNTEPEMIIQAVQAAAGGQALLCPEVTLRIIRRGTSGTEEQSAAAPQPALSPEDARVLGELTNREREVLIKLASGLSNAEIAVALFVSEATVKTHLSNVLAKAGVRDRVQAVVFAYRAGLIPSTES